MKKKPLFAVIGGSGLYDLNGIIKSKLINPSTPYGKPSDKILIETDSPFLAPVPKRGKTNEPSYLKYTLEHMAKIKNISPQEMELITSQNFKKLFEVN